ncbi:MAG: VCBS repeat-containing protein [Verrucomicrobiota bacterium]|nr:VCBS repeat-containing protein [Verrucomicrobiota bacterium]
MKNSVLPSIVLYLAVELSLNANEVQWEAHSGYRSAALLVPAEGKTGFTLQNNSGMGIAFTNRIAAEKIQKRQNLMNGSGLAAGDYDGDGWCDLFFCNKEGPSALYRNLGNWKFENVTAKAGVAMAEQSSSGAVFADVNGDGALDLLVTSFGGPNALWINQRNGTFSNITVEAGLELKGNTTSMALGDMNGDGPLDLYINNFAIVAILRDGGTFSTKLVNGKPVVQGRYANRLKIVNNAYIELGEPDFCFFNKGNGLFSEAPWPATFLDEEGKPMAPPLDFGLAVQIRDIDGDHDPDIYVCNDFQTPDRIWLNDGKGKFRAIEKLAIRNMSYASMGVDMADLDRDGKLEIFTVEMLSRSHQRGIRQSSAMMGIFRVPGDLEGREEVARNALYWNRGDGTYSEIGFYSGLAASDWSWAPIFLDADLDGYEDVLVSNGHMHDVNDLDVAEAVATERGKKNATVLERYPVLDPPKAAFHNLKNLRFEDVSREWGFDSTSIAHGMALADLDRDGDQDVILNCINAPPLIYRNDSAAPRLAVRLKGKAPNRFGIGGKIKVLGGPVEQQQEIIAGGRYLAGDEPMRTFAAWNATNQFTIEVIWRQGSRSVVKNAVANRIYEIDEEVSEPLPEDLRRKPRPLFREVSDKLPHRHHEDSFDDIARQPGLPRKLCQPGPALVSGDWNGDARDELLIGSGAGGRIELFEVGANGFQRSKVTFPACPGDIAGMVMVPSAEGNMEIVYAISGYQSGTDSALVALRQGEVEAKELDRLPVGIGPLAAADIDRDGDLDLFVGGRVLAGKYPVAVSSFIYRRDARGLSRDENASGPFREIGMVSGAVFSDVTGDGWVDLVLATEWGPIRVFVNEKGTFVEQTRRLGLETMSGLWNGVATADFNGDGRLDIVASNCGRNTKYEIYRNPRIYFTDANQDGTVELLEAHLDRERNTYVPDRGLKYQSRIFPTLRQRYPTHQAFASATAEEILNGFGKVSFLEARTLEHTLFLNLPDGFHARPLPPISQFAPGFAVVPADFDGDGSMDIFMSQNFFACDPETSRNDGGRGILIKGNGRGGFECVEGEESGIKIYGEQRAAVTADVDGDGRLELVVCQNGNRTVCYEAAEAKPGIRVRLKHSRGNPGGIGAKIEHLRQDGTRALHEVQAGCGYWTQNSLVQILTAASQGDQVKVYWPGGDSSGYTLPANAGEILLTAQGPLEVVK